MLAVEVEVEVVAGPRVMRLGPASPGMEVELAAGAVLSTGMASWQDPPPEVWREDEGRRVHVKLKGHEQLWPPLIREGGVMELGLAASLTSRMHKRQRLFPATGAAHAAALFDSRGELLAMAEDISRHNALDKAAGKAWMEGTIVRAQALALSSRVSAQMLTKAAYTGVGIVVSVSAPTARAVELARELGMTLIGFARPGRANIYSHPWRVGIGEETHD